MIGTCNFKSLYAAQCYYRQYGFNLVDVEEKIRNNEITIGEPTITAQQSLLIDSDGRYHIRGDM
jgi:hypothetical protein